MPTKTPLIAIRLIGFAEQEAETFATVLAVARERGYRYNVLKAGSLQDPDLYIVNAEELRALATLSDLNLGDAHPVLLIGKTEISHNYDVMARPIKWRKLFDVLDSLIDRRQLLLNTLTAFNSVTVPERRRSERLDLDLTEPEEYERKRRLPMAQGGILIVDKDTRFREYVALIMDPYKVEVTLATDDRSALMLNRTHRHALVMINTSIPNIDPYQLCGEIKRQNLECYTTIIFLIDRHFQFDLPKSQQVGCEGFLNKPLSRKQVLSTIKKFLQLK